MVTLLLGCTKIKNHNKFIKALAHCLGFLVTKNLQFFSVSVDCIPDLILQMELIPYVSRRYIHIFIILFPIVNLSASYKDEVHYTQLINELNLRGISLPTGAGVSVTQVEARENTNGNGILESYEGYTPNPSSSEFSGKTLTDVSNLGQNPSNHGTWVGRNLYGNTSSISPGITNVSVYETNNFLNSGWYSGTPSVESNPLQNHSWVNWFQNSNAPRRMDYAVNRDGFYRS